MLLSRLPYRPHYIFITTACYFSRVFSQTSSFESTVRKMSTAVPNHNNIGDEIWKDGYPEFASLSHPGYNLRPDEDTQLGGWLAHRIEGAEESNCWVKAVSPKLTRFEINKFGLDRKPRILILYGSLRPTSFSRKLAYEFARLLEELGCDVRTYNPRGLPVRDLALENELKVQEIRALSLWSDGHVWVSPEMHGKRNASNS